MLCYALSYALVGGAWNNGVNAGLWYWNVNNASSNTSANIGARLIIWDLMCMRLFMVFS